MPERLECQMQHNYSASAGDSPAASGQANRLPHLGSCMATDLRTPTDMEKVPEQRLLPAPKETAPRGSKRRWIVTTLLLAGLLAYGGYRWVEKKKADEAASAARKKAQASARAPVAAVAARGADMPVYLTGL